MQGQSVTQSLRQSAIESVTQSVIESVKGREEEEDFYFFVFPGGVFPAALHTSRLPACLPACLPLNTHMMMHPIHPHNPPTHPTTPHPNK